MDFSQLTNHVITISGLVIGTTEPVKKHLKLKSWKAVLLTVFVSLAFSLSVISLGLVYYIVVSALSCLAANGLFQVVTKSSQ